MNRRDALAKALEEIQYREDCKAGLEKAAGSRHEIEESLAVIFATYDIPERWAKEMANRCLPKIENEIRFALKAFTESLASADVDSLAKYYEQTADLRESSPASI